MKKTRLFLVDDHTLFRETWSQFLSSRKGLEICGHTGQPLTALDSINTLRPDIVLLDIAMAPLTGIDLLPQIKKSNPAIKVIMLTMYSSPLYVKKTKELGAAGYVTKNSPMEEVLTAISEVQQGKHYVCEEIKEQVAMEMLDPQSAKKGLHMLTERELGVARLIKNGHTSKEIATMLNISYRTIEVHRHNILLKLSLKNGAALVNFLHGTEIDS